MRASAAVSAARARHRRLGRHGLGDDRPLELAGGAGGSCRPASPSYRRCRRLPWSCRAPVSATATASCSARTGLIGADYQGPLMVSLWNRSAEALRSAPGMHRATGVPAGRPCRTAVVEAFAPSDREGVFGSSDGVETGRKRKPALLPGRQRAVGYPAPDARSGRSAETVMAAQQPAGTGKAGAAAGPARVSRARARDSGLRVLLPLVAATCLMLLALF